MTQYEDTLGDPVSPVSSTSIESVIVTTKLTRFSLKSQGKNNPLAVGRLASFDKPGLKELSEKGLPIRRKRKNSDNE